MSTTEEPRAPTAWHADAPAGVLSRLGTTEGGLSSHEAAARLARHGPNRSPRIARPSALELLLGELRNPLIYPLLLLSAAVAIALGNLEDSLVVLAVVVLNALIGFNARRSNAGLITRPWRSPRGMWTRTRPAGRTAGRSLLMSPGPSRPILRLTRMEPSIVFAWACVIICHRPSVPLEPIVIISTNQFKNGNHIEVDGTVFKVLEFQHVKPGKGGAFVRTKLRRAQDGAVIDRTFRAGEKFRAVRTESRKMQFLYADGTDAHFMDAESYEQLAIPEDSLRDALRWTRPNDSVDLLFIDERPNDLAVPSAVDLEVTETEPGLRGDTVSGGGDKPATLETGATIRVPLFVNVGDRVRVDTRSGHYVSRA